MKDISLNSEVIPTFHIDKDPAKLVFIKEFFDMCKNHNILVY
jgi:hypothetical protein